MIIVQYTSHGGVSELVHPDDTLATHWRLGTVHWARGDAWAKSSRAWNRVQICDGSRTVCVASNPLIPPGCVWPDAAQPSGVQASPNVSLSPSTVSNTILSSTAPVISARTSSTALSTASDQPSAAVSGAVPSVSASTGDGQRPSTQFSNPHYAIYHNRASRTLPSSAADIKPWNRWYFAFWQTNGPQDAVATFAAMPESDRQAMIADFHANGIAIMVSAFGANDVPTTSGANPTETANALAAFVKQYGLDGCDVDYEDSGAFITGTAYDWLLTFQTALRAQLPAPYIISHAPQPAYMITGQYTTKGGYKELHAAVGSGIDFYSVQYYNQGSYTPYTDCDSLITSAPDGSALLQVAESSGIPLNKLVIGKPLNGEDVSNSGLMDAATLGQCYQMAKSNGWNAGIMVWQWETDGAPAFLNTVLGT
ncbi:glycoside hydrolase superfamily [Kockovaella imperatae]|uniref:Glycoside hydrolase superfamily n=1 Tax=Kockovaella imperatae TaxID=4999 RepID=A0A1Y1UDX6_9TREE|nr:glycoside hydrolase superfamily [Kockovaella imperatae]ORX36222.1 glycoside hydrolase superfamily [Kockovaella imperatae]